jgi:hypothetical protein
LKDLIGDYKKWHIDNPLEVADPEVKSKSLLYVFNDKNNIFADIEAVQRSMIMLYGITVHGEYSCHFLHEYSKLDLLCLL